MFRCVMLLVSLPGIFAPGHHLEQPHHLVMADCYGHACGDHTPVCQIREEHGHIEGHCAGHHECHHHCTHGVVLRHDGCCCKNQTCVNDFKAGQSVQPKTVHCRDCHDVRNFDCEADYQLCHGDELCMVKFVDFRIETHCAPAHECTDEHHPGPHGHHNEKIVCCQNDTCVRNAINPPQDTTTTMATVVTDKPITMKPVVTDTPATIGSTSASAVSTNPSAPTCTNNDNSGYCEQNAQKICTSIDYKTHLHAVANCAETCSFCIEYLAMLQNTPDGEKSTTLAMSTTTSTMSTTTSAMSTTTPAMSTTTMPMSTTTPAMSTTTPPMSTTTPPMSTSGSTNSQNTTQDFSFNVSVSG